ncbi:4Fe-4S binding protein, partial [Deinococcus pimensis]|uniref:4Fe-4S binding protein n=1 Tax=Deinococcus pimensis TaxID=309888 RepID=UPI0005EB4265
MLDSLLNILGEYGNPVPRFTGQRCLVERMTVGGCDLCARACPHDAVTIDRTVTIDEKLCTGCGLCTQVCPSGALEFDVTSVLGAVREQPPEEPARLVCSRSGEAGKQLLCLARVT